jgi:hypothetical protein
MGTTSITFHAHLPKRVSKSRQAFLPRNNNALSAVYLPLSGKEMLLQFNDHC